MFFKKFIGSNTENILPQSHFHQYAATHSMGLCTLFLSLGLILALSYSLVINKFLSIAGSVFFTLIGNLKFIFIIILSYYIFHDELTITNVIGVFITFIGFMLYSYFKDADENKNDNLENSEQKFQNGEKTIQYDDVYGNNEENEFLLTTNDHVRYSNKFETEVIDDVDNGNSNNNNKTLQWVFYVETFLSIFVLIMLFSFLFLGHNNNKQQGALLLLNNNNNNNSNFNNKKNVSISNVRMGGK